MKCFFNDQGIALDPNGDIVPCCRFLKSNLDCDNIEDVTSLNNIKDSKIFFDMKETLSKKKWYSGCIRCERDENYGITSRRETYENYDKRVVDVALGNVCNLKCIMCDNRFSSQWSKDQKTLTDHNFTYYENRYPDSTKTLSKKNVEKIISWIEQDITPVEVEFKGGEPFSIPVTEYFFKRLSEIRNEVDIVITTNGTLIPEWFVNVTKKLNITVNISIDGIDSIYDYIRGNEKYNYKLFENNLEKISKLPVKLRLAYVVQNTNIHQLKTCIEKYEHLKVNTIFLRNPPWLQLWNMPDENKDKIYNELLSIPKNTFKYYKIQTIIDNFTNKKNDNEYRDFIKFSAIIDQNRNKNLPNIVPHLFTSKSLQEYHNIRNSI